MSIVKSFSVGEGDMFYIKHDSDNFTVIDCCNYGNGRSIDFKLFETHLYEIIGQSKNKSITRFISTHPDDDHISGLCDYEKEIKINNFYCVKNKATKDDITNDFKKYCSLRDASKAFYLHKGCSRKWLNGGDEERDPSGINCLWPDTTNSEYNKALEEVQNGKSPNNISPILTYSIENVVFMWMGDLETDFLEKIKDNIVFSKVAILFAPHHGRDSGKIPEDILKDLNPKIIVIGEAPSEDLNYYRGYNKITQNSAGDIVFEMKDHGVNIFVGNKDYSVDYLYKYDYINNYAYGCHYIGTLDV